MRICKHFSETLVKKNWSFMCHYVLIYQEIQLSPLDKIYQWHWQHQQKKYMFRWINWIINYYTVWILWQNYETNSNIRPIFLRKRQCLPKRHTTQKLKGLIHWISWKMNQSSMWITSILLFFTTYIWMGSRFWAINSYIYLFWKLFNSYYLYSYLNFTIPMSTSDLYIRFYLFSY